MDKVVILMSTYNGSKYLREQINSILTQTGVSIHILVRDDGSSDDTISILEEYKTNNPDIIEIIQGENIGWQKSFFLLAEYASHHFPDYFYFAFSDQDDIWMPEKLRQAIVILSQSQIIPSLYCSNLIYYKKGKQDGLYRKKTFIPTYKNCLIRNCATGCTIVMNKALLKAISRHPSIESIPHDHWAYMVATLCGKSYVDNNSFILYRQHENNQLGCNRSLSQIWKARLKTSRSKNWHYREKIAKELIRIHGHKMPLEALASIQKIANYRMTFLNRIKLLFDKGYSYNNRSNDFWLKLRILLGKL